MEPKDEVLYLFFPCSGCIFTDIVELFHPCLPKRLLEREEVQVFTWGKVHELSFRRQRERRVEGRSDGLRKFCKRIGK